MSAQRIGFFSVNRNRLIMAHEKGFKDIMDQKQLHSDARKAMGSRNNRAEIPFKKVEVHDYYKDHRCPEQDNTDYLETVVDHWRRTNQAIIAKPAIFARIGALFTIISPLIGLKKKFSNATFELLSDMSGLRIWKENNEPIEPLADNCKDGLRMELSLTKEGQREALESFTFGEKLLYSVTRHPFKDFDLFVSKEVDAFCCKAENPSEYEGIEIKSSSNGYNNTLIIKSYLGGIRKCCIPTINDKYITKVELFDLESEFTVNKVLFKFMDILEPFLYIIGLNARRGKSGEIWTRHMENAKFLILQFKDKMHYWKLDEYSRTFNEEKIIDLTCSNLFQISYTPFEQVGKPKTLVMRNLVATHVLCLIGDIRSHFETNIYNQPEEILKSILLMVVDKEQLQLIEENLKRNNKNLFPILAMENTVISREDQVVPSLWDDNSYTDEGNCVPDMEMDEEM